jgi:hypothetical protein
MIDAPVGVFLDDDGAIRTRHRLTPEPDSFNGRRIQTRRGRNEIFGRSSYDRSKSGQAEKAAKPGVFALSGIAWK